MSLVMEHNTAIKETVDKVKTVLAVVAFGAVIVLVAYVLGHAPFSGMQDNAQAMAGYGGIKPPKGPTTKINNAPITLPGGDGGDGGGGTDEIEVTPKDGEGKTIVPGVIPDQKIPKDGIITPDELKRGRQKPLAPKT